MFLKTRKSKSAKVKLGIKNQQIALIHGNSKWSWLAKVKASKKIKFVIWLVFCNRLFRHYCLKIWLRSFYEVFEGLPDSWNDMGSIGFWECYWLFVYRYYQVDYLICPIDRAQLFLAMLWWIWRQQNRAALDGNYEGDEWLLRKFTVWLRIGNLLGESVTRNLWLLLLFHVRDGVKVSLNLMWMIVLSVILAEVDLMVLFRLVMELIWWVLQASNATFFRNC